MCQLVLLIIYLLAVVVIVFLLPLTVFSFPLTYRGLVPLHNACSYGHFEVTEMLLKAGANVNTMDLWQFTPLHEAASKYRLEVGATSASEFLSSCIRHCHCNATCYNDLLSFRRYARCYWHTGLTPPYQTVIIKRQWTWPSPTCRSASTTSSRVTRCWRRLDRRTHRN